LLGLLAYQSWSAYELAQQATRSLRYTHPRTESHLYQEAKRLVALGWAESSTEHHGRRSRTIYVITAEGRAALEAWFHTPPRDPQLDFEPLLRVLFADHSDKGTLDQCLQHTAESARRQLDDGVERLLRGYLAEDGGPFPERQHIVALVAAFVADYLQLIERWSEFARREIQSWARTDGLRDPARSRQILEAVVAGRSALD
jgi:DNA-binding PadR family transcriptional regulator